jgi:hypothetical protein
MTAPAYVAYTVLGGSLAILAALLLGLRLALARAAWPPEERASIWRKASLVLIVWFAAALTLSWLEFFRGGPDRIPTIEIGLLVPIIVGIIALWRSETVGRIVDAVPQSWLVGVQVYRTIGVIFVLLLASGKLPGVFALPAGLGDVLVGISAPLVALLCAREAKRSALLVRAWNAFGLLDLVVAVGTGFMTSPSPLQLLAFDAPNQLISAFPLVMVPVFAVPVAILLHLTSLMKLQQTQAHGNTLRSVAACAHWDDENGSFRMTNSPAQAATAWAGGPPHLTSRRLNVRFADVCVPKQPFSSRPILP